ncbi:MAG: DUF1329 domain-containing protein [Steroidobacteraceae bacterium]
MLRKSLLAIAITTLCLGAAHAAVSTEEAKQLGSTLTATGAEKAGNKGGSIPPYTGGLTVAPAGFKKGDGIRPDPFASEKPLFSIDAKNMSQYADKLTEGSKALLTRYPSYRMDVYPTHRTVAFPEAVVDNTLKNATQAKTTDGGVGIRDAYGGVPFPIPKDGYEVMWNHLLRYSGQAYVTQTQAYNMDQSGRAVLATQATTTQQFPYYDPRKTATEIYYMIRVEYTAPARRAGEALLVKEPLNYMEKGRRAWQYLSGQRRVKLAPDVAYDTPNPANVGMETYDDAFIFNGKMDRYEFRLVGRREIYIPYNAYKLVYQSKREDVLRPNVVNPDFVRWELHRMWVVEATLKKGERHIYAKRRFYIDEDSWVALACESYDARGELFRTGFAQMAPSYDVPASYTDTQVSYDFTAGTYSLSRYRTVNGGVRYIDALPETFWTPDSLVGTGIR